MMRIDLSCPVEMLDFQRADFGSDRTQGYVTFLNESSQEITCVKGKLTILEEGEAVFEKDVTLSSLSCMPGEKLDAHLALDGAPEGDEARFEPYTVSFSDGSRWFFSEEALADCPEPRAPEGREKIALIAMAGADARYYPCQADRVWLCVCGRFNRSRWGYCRRCARNREETLLLTEESVLAQYEEYEQEMKRQGSFAKKEPAQVPAAQKRAAVQAAPSRPRNQKSSGKKKARKRKNPALRILSALLCLAVACGVLLGVYAAANSLLNRMNAAASYQIEYLEPVE